LGLRLPIPQEDGKDAANDGVGNREDAADPGVAREDGSAEAETAAGVGSENGGNVLVRAVRQIPLESGRYRAETPLVVGLFFKGHLREYQEQAPGQEFEVPVGVGHGWIWAVTYFSDMGEPRPKFTRLPAGKI
jgi:hypothetical protein